ncbi:uncharacterized protein LOC122500031 isoform X2 [Leptopilina heterotoma]|uniref:uncharacterized protein LOC122500031 isoform X2 n=1 Tax=Leptopilina heterotoma TaxID=63436 RepID=UPI001CA927FC|nr:uncharacterized protein LOC122500031 isoform X2 [Leptopilina heterotoma]
MNYNTYRTSALKILRNFKKRFNQGKTKTRSQELKTSKYPYQINETNKVQLLKGSKIYIDKNKLMSLKNEFTDNASMMISLLLNYLFGEENLPSFAWTGAYGYKPIPQELKKSIFEFVNENVIDEQKKSYESYEHIVKYLLRSNKVRFQKEKLKTYRLENKKLIYPYKKEGKNKVELLKNSKIWLPENKYNSYVKNFKNEPMKLIRMLLGSLMGKENLKYLSFKGQCGYERIPENVIIAILKFVNKNVKRRHQVTNLKLHKAVNKFLWNIRAKANEGMTLQPSGDSVDNTLKLPEEYPYQKKEEGKVELTTGSNIWIDEKKLKIFTTSFKNDPFELTKILLKNLLGKENLPHFAWNLRSKYEQIAEKVKSAIMTYVNKNVMPGHKKEIELIFNKNIGLYLDNFRCISKSGSKTRKQFDIESYICEKPERFPYQEEEEGKIELVPESKIWIKKEEFDKLNKYTNVALNKLIQQLLENLLGKENIIFFTLNGIGLYEPVPDNLSNAIYEFVKDKARVSKTFTYESCLKAIGKALMKSRSNFEPGSKTRKQFDIESYICEKPERFPYQEEEEGKIELVPESQIWIKKEEFNKLNKYSNVALNKLIQELLENLLGKENMILFTLSGSGLYEPVPGNLSNAIYEFVKDKARVSKTFTHKKCLMSIENVLAKARNNY